MLDMKLIYVFDAYCGWSYGFARTMADVAHRHPDLPVEVVSGGLFLGGRRVPIRQFGYVQGANAEITRRTGAPFGESYERLIADGEFVMDSEAAACGMAALREVGPDRAVRLAALLQEAFYLDGLSLSEVSTYRVVAQQPAWTRTPSRPRWTGFPRRTTSGAHGNWASPAIRPCWPTFPGNGS